MSAEDDPTIIDCKDACEGCPAANEGLMVSDITRSCPHYENHVYTVDGNTVEVTSHECHNVEMLGKYAGAGVVETKHVNPSTGEEITER